MSRYRPAREKTEADRNEVNAKKGVLTAVEVLRIKQGLERGRSQEFWPDCSK